MDEHKRFISGLYDMGMFPDDFVITLPHWAGLRFYKPWKDHSVLPVAVLTMKSKMGPSTFNFTWFTMNAVTVEIYEEYRGDVRIVLGFKTIQQLTKADSLIWYSKVGNTRTGRRE